MAGKISPKVQEKMDMLEEGMRKASRIYSLIEQYAAAKNGHDSLASMIRNASTDVSRLFMTAGLGVLADGANQIAMLVKRGGPTPSKFRAMRELIGTLRAGIDRASKAVLQSARDIPD